MERECDVCGRLISDPDDMMWCLPPQNAEPRYVHVRCWRDMLRAAKRGDA